MADFNPLAPFDFLGVDHFDAAPTREAAVRTFARSVVMVEVEVFSYCNRRCWFCPNAVVDRHSSTTYMPEPMYLGILSTLQEVDYRETISYSRYNEPLADRVILRRLAQARAALPGARLHTNTNGDYLTPAYLDDLARVGLSSLNIQVYLGNDDPYDHQRAGERLRQIDRKLGLDATVTRDEPGTWLEAVTTTRGIAVRIYARNFAVNGCDRGGSVPVPAPGVRTSPCLSPFYHVYVDYTGKVMPCCNLRSDLPAHQDAIVGDLRTGEDIVTIYAGTAMAGWRSHLAGFGAKSGVCASCTFATFEATPDHLAATAPWPPR